MSYFPSSMYGASPYGQNVFAQLMAMLNPQAQPAAGMGTMSGIAGAAPSGMAGSPSGAAPTMPAGNMNMFAQIMALMQNPQARAGQTAPSMYGPVPAGINMPGPGMINQLPIARSTQQPGGITTPSGQYIPPMGSQPQRPITTIGMPGIVNIPGG